MSSSVSHTNTGLIGDSPEMQAVAREIAVAARCDLTVLICGESGTGKELVARAIHQQSARARKPLVALNCGALTETLLEAELFGHERGAFTGAHEKRKGLFEAAHCGSIFLDEIGEMSSACQVKLLRVLEEKAVRPVGSLTERPVDVRVIAATNCNLGEEMVAGRFREDLFYRLLGLTIDLPPLRRRPSDIPLLVQHFLRQAEAGMRCRSHKLAPQVLTLLTHYLWPGNVRELRNVVERLLADSIDAEVITAQSAREVLASAAPFAQPAPEIVLDFEANESLPVMIDRALLHLYDRLLAKNGSHAEVARQLRTDRVALRQRLARARDRLVKAASR